MALVLDVIDDGMVSIQGEQQAAAADVVKATDAEVDEFVRGLRDGWISCRERGRHLFASVRVGGMRFVGVNPEGLLIRRVACDSCGVVVRVELWDVRHKRGVVTRAEFVSASLDYTDPAYLAKKGHGRMTPRQVRNALASWDLEGESFREVLRAAREAAKGQGQ